jgi:short-subunit dehydrogenase
MCSSVLRWSAFPKEIKMSEKVWFITGASRGLGKEFAKTALEAGDHVVATSRSAESVSDALGTSDRLLALSLDVTKPETAIRAVQASLERFGRIDVLVNNAGYALFGSVEECNSHEVETQYRTNVFGLLDVTRAVLPTLRKQRSGHILNMSSTAGIAGAAGASSYCGTKFAVEGISESLAAELKPLGIHVTIVAPGYFRTDFLTNNSVRYATEEIADYAGTSGITRERLANMNGQQQGDPHKLALTLVKIVNLSDPPLRFAAGDDAVRAVEKKIEGLAHEVKTWRDLSVSMAHV